MPNAVFESLSLVGPAGLTVIAAILASLALGIAATAAIYRRYARMAHDLEKRSGPFDDPALRRIMADAKEASSRAGEVNTQVLVENGFQAELKPTLLAERFVRSSGGLMIILGLLNTFYGLTLSVGRLVSLVSGDGGATTDLTQAVTHGLTNALGGMAVAFSTSLFGVASATVMTILGILFNVADRHTAVMIQVEAHLDRILAGRRVEEGASSFPAPSGAARAAGVVDGLNQSVERLDAAVGRFDAALQAFATSTRDFREFNLHLKDNVQRMSLSFGDLSETLKTHIVSLRSRNGG